MSPSWRGVYCALWTPTDQNGALLEGALEANLRFLKSNRITGLLVLGSTGEFLHLDVAVRQQLIERAASTASPLRLIVNISDLRPRVVQQLARFARAVGAEAVSVLPPSFYPVAQEDLVEFFVRAGEAAGLPLFLYNFPERAGNRIDLATLAAVAERVPVAGIKQSGGEFGYHADLVKLGREKGFDVVTGADTRLPEALALGVSGCVSGLANAVPDCVVDAFEGSGEAADHMTLLARQIEPLQFPLDVAAAMEARGQQIGHPKSIISPATERRYRMVVGSLRDCFAEWNLR